MFRFTIRDVLWLTVVVGLATVWQIDHWAAAKRYRDLMSAYMRISPIRPDAEIPK